MGKRQRKERKRGREKGRTRRGQYSTIKMHPDRRKN